MSKASRRRLLSALYAHVQAEGALYGKALLERHGVRLLSDLTGVEIAAILASQS
jgi:hypothetical protein